MGHLDKLDLLDVIRHEMRLEDEDGPGLCNKLILPVSRRSKHGGLPLNFRNYQLDDDYEEDDEFDNDYQIGVYDESLDTREIINEHLAQRTAENIKEEKKTEDNSYKGDLNELFSRERVIFPVQVPEGTKSAIERYLEENADSLNNPLSDYMQFEASPGMPSRTILIIYDRELCENEMRSIRICVLATARVREVIGYAMLRFHQQFNEQLPGEVEDYQLYMAEDDGEIEDGLPALGTSEIISKFGFDCLGLVNTTRKKGVRKKKVVVIVHFVDKVYFPIEVDNLEKPLKWLKEEAMRKRKEMEEEEGTEKDLDGLMFVDDYYMETVDQFDQKLDLECSIASTRCLEFVMIRKNSARAGFHPRGARYGRQMSAMLTLKMPNSPIPMATMTPLPTARECSSPTFKWTDDGGKLSSFNVVRVHRYKPNWRAKLVFRWTCFEIERVAIQRTFLPNGYQKGIQVPWEFVGGVRVQKKEVKQDRPDTWQITIFWLPVLDEETVHSVVGDDEWNLMHVTQLYENEERWKNVTIESMMREDVEQIESQMKSMLSARDSSIHKAFMHSSFGQKSPAMSADMAMMDSVDPAYISATNPPARKLTNARKLSKILMSPIVNVVNHF